jgi:hypothetical protein
MRSSLGIMVGPLIEKKNAIKRGDLPLIRTLLSEPDDDFIPAGLRTYGWMVGRIVFSAHRRRRKDKNGLRKEQSCKEYKELLYEKKRYKWSDQNQSRETSSAW